jgi:uncharacterized OB-fold protein
MTQETIEKPQPQPSETAKGYWEAARQGRFVLQTCADCGKIRHYPRPVCDECYSLAVRWTEASGRGRVHSWTVAHHAYHPAFKGEVPYVLLTVELDEGVRALGRLAGEASERLRLDQPVRLGMAPTENGYALPVFELIATESPSK